MSKRPGLNSLITLLKRLQRKTWRDHLVEAEVDPALVWNPSRTSVGALSCVQLLGPSCLIPVLSSCRKLELCRWISQLACSIALCHGSRKCWPTQLSSDKCFFKSLCMSSTICPESPKTWQKPGPGCILWRRTWCDNRSEKLWQVC